jgi:hypothetical protein
MTQYYDRTGKTDNHLAANKTPFPTAEAHLRACCPACKPSNVFPPSDLCSLYPRRSPWAINFCFFIRLLASDT